MESGRLFYCTQRGGYREMVVRLNDQSRHHVERILGMVEEAIGTGFLPAAPTKEACGRCDYKAVCGPYEYEREICPEFEKHPELVQLGLKVHGTRHPAPTALPPHPAPTKHG